METVETSVLQQYRAVRQTVGFLDLSNRGKIEVTGPDRVTFLHAMISNDVQELKEFAGRYGTFLTATGKIISDFFYYKFPDRLIMDLAPQLVGKTMQTLRKFIVMDEVDLEDISGGLAHFSLQGPRSPELVEQLFGEAGPSDDYQVRQLNKGESRHWLIRKNELAEAGFEVVLSERAASSLRSAIWDCRDAFELCEVGDGVRNVLRLEQGIPWYGVDMDETNYPMEARLDSAISLTKGCYIGQEVVSKATHIGGVNRILTGLKFKDPAIPAKDAPVLSSEGKPIGKITSGVFSPRLQCPIAFAYLKRALVFPGKLCQVEVSEGSLVSAEMVEKFS